MALSYSATHISLVQLLRRQMEHYVDLHNQIAADYGGEMWSSRLDEEQLVIVLLLASYLEALINLYLSFKMTTEQLSLIERNSPVEKWTVVPSLLLPEFKIDRSSTLCADLTSLFQRRNQIMHMRPEFQREGKKVHKGNPIATSREDHEKLLRWLRLPVALVEHLKRFDKSHDFVHFTMGNDVWQLKIDWERRLTPRLSGRRPVRKGR